MDTKFTYGHELRWARDFSGCMTVSVRGLRSPEEAKAKALEVAAEFGWKPARWWEIHRLLSVDDHTEVTDFERRP